MRIGPVKASAGEMLKRSGGSETAMRSSTKTPAQLEPRRPGVALDSLGRQFFFFFFFSQLCRGGTC